MRTDAKAAPPVYVLSWAALVGGLVLLIAGTPTLFDFVNKAHSVSTESAIMALADAISGVGLAVTGSLLIAGALVGLSIGSGERRDE